jgi:GMP synthase (glutamine-hydrolysing)
MVYVLDFGSQYSHLIVRRIRELGVFAELVSPHTSLETLKTAEALILSGGPQNLSESSALRVDKGVFNLGLPMLGVCYGLQLMAYELGGKVKAGKKREYGPATVTVKSGNALFKGLRPNQQTWMSHGDEVSVLPKGFANIGTSTNCKNAAIANETKKFYGIQFHPEVTQTANGMKILDNFLKH